MKLRVCGEAGLPYRSASYQDKAGEDRYFCYIFEVLQSTC